MDSLSAIQDSKQIRKLLDAGAMLSRQDSTDRWPTCITKARSLVWGVSWAQTQSVSFTCLLSVNVVMSALVEIGSFGKPGRRRQRGGPKNKASWFVFLYSMYVFVTLPEFLTFAEVLLLPSSLTTSARRSFSKWCPRLDNNLKMKQFSEVARESRTTPRSSQFHIFTCSCLQLVLLFYRRCCQLVWFWPPTLLIFG